MGFRGWGKPQASSAESGGPRVVVVGAGAGGICMGTALRRLGLEDFTIFEQSDGIGGTWHDNVFPGAEVDTEVPFYSFSFHTFDFTRTHVKQPELRRYFENVADRFQLKSNLQFNTAVTRAEWDERTHSYLVTTSDGVSRECDVVITAVGILNNPRYPEWPGLELFRGDKFHSSRWDYGVQLAGRRVAVVGTGSTCAQLVPAIAPDVDALYVYQRQPGWLVPKGDRYFSPRERALLMRGWYRRWRRFRQALIYENVWDANREGTKRNLQAQRLAEEYIETVFKDRPDLQKIVTPAYPFGGKRTMKDSNFYPALLRDNVELIPHAVTHVTPNCVVDETGCEREVDVLVMCTGFQPTNFLATIDIIGRDGVSIHEAWKGEPQGYLGINVTGFPNFYMLYGPNTNGVPLMWMHERQSEFIAANLKRMMKSGVTSIEPKESFMNAFNRYTQKRLARDVSALHPEVHNYGITESRRNVISWPEGLVKYSFLTHMTPRISSIDRRKSK